MIHHHPTQRKGYAMTMKWNTEFFCRIGLISSNWLYYNKMYGYTVDQYIERQTKKMKAKRENHIARLKEKGQEYYTPDRIKKIANCQSFALT
jgi:cell division protein FtsL